MSDTYLTLPSDAGNSGKNLALVSKQQGADTVHMHVTVSEWREPPVGVFRTGLTAASGQALAVTANNGTSTGLLWITNPSTSTKKVRIRKIDAMFNVLGATTLTTWPRIVAQRFTWTGTPSGAALLPAILDGEDIALAAVADFRSAVTGLTVSLVANAFVALCMPPVLQLAGTAANIAPLDSVKIPMFDADYEDEFIVLMPGQGLVIYQADAGGASTETRKIMLRITHDEVSI